MIRKSPKPADQGVTEKAVISDYVRLCLMEGKKPDDAYNEMKRKLQTIKESKTK